MPTEPQTEVIYEVDAQDHIVTCGGAWDAFQRTNGPGDLPADEVSGHSLWEFVRDPDTREVYRLALESVRNRRAVLNFPYRCDAPDCRRWFEMRIEPMDDRHVRFVSVMQREEPRRTIIPLTFDVRALVRCCSLCNRILIRDKALEIEEAMPHLQDATGDGDLRVAYSVCSPCSQAISTRVHNLGHEARDTEPILDQASTSDADSSTPSSIIGGGGHDPVIAHPTEQAMDDEDLLKPDGGKLVVVGIGASAGGLEAITRFFQAMPADPGVAFVVVQHLSPDFKSHMPELLGRHTNLAIHVVESGMKLEPNAVYMLPPGSNIRVEDDSLQLDPKEDAHRLSFPIDIFFESLASALGPKAAAVVLSGSGSDGSRGIIYVKEAGGLVMVQQPETAQFDGMPRTAIATEAPDYVLDPEEMPDHLLRYLAHSPLIEVPSKAEAHVEKPDLLEEVISILAERRNHDFSGYRTKPLMRRILRRMSVVHARSPESYLETLRINQLEVDALFSDLLINVTSFLRNEEAFHVVRDQVLPGLIEHALEPKVLRIWVAGCSTGEEIYSLMALLETAIENADPVVDYRIFATDVDQEALAKASAATYSESALAPLERSQVERVFERREANYVVRRELRNKVVFAPHDLTTDPPFTRIDLILCRNVLIYFRSELQEEVLRHLHFALSPGGILFLGHSESLGSLSPYFNPIDMRWKIWKKTQEAAVIPASMSSPLGLAPHRTPREPVTPRPHLADAERRRPSQLDMQRAQVAELESVLQTQARIANSCVVVTDARKEVLQVFGDTSIILNVPSGRASLNILDLVSPSLKNALSSALRRAATEPEAIVYRRLRMDDQSSADLVVSRIEGQGQRRTVFLANFTFRSSGTQSEDASTANQHADERIRQLEEEVNNLQQELRGTLEDASTTSEELQAANEEMMASNEELQGTNEELQSVNEELHTINAEHQQKIQELAKLSEDMENLLKSTGIGTVFLDSDLMVRKFTPSVSDIVPLMVKDIGRPIGHIAPRLPSVDLEALSKQAMADAVAIERRVTSDSGEHFLMRVHPYRATEGRTRGVVLTFVDLRVLERSDAPAPEGPTLFRLLANVTDDAFLVFTAEDGRFVHASSRYLDLFEGTMEELEGDAEAWLSHVHPDDRSRVRARRTGSRMQREDTIEYRILAADGSVRWVADRRCVIEMSGPRGAWVLQAVRDITEARENVRQLRALASALDFQANNDSLTGLPNRRGMARELQREQESLRRVEGQSLTGALARVRGLEAVNHLLGHAVGDALLKKVGESLGASIHDQDEVGRIGGDQFLILMHLEVGPAAQEALMRVRRHANDAIPLALPRNHDLEVSVEVDGFDVPREIATVEELVASGERQIMQRGSDLQPRSNSDRIAHLVDSDSYHALVQGIHDVASGETVGYEFLSRSTIAGMTQPDEFFTAAENLKIQQRVDLTCLQVCASTAAKQGVDRPIHLNVLPSTLLATPAADIVKLIREDSGLGGEVVLEIRASDRFTDPERLARHTEDFAHHGIRLALDDVGLARGSMDALVALQPDMLKIDGTLIRAALVEPERRRTLERVLRFGRSLQTRVIAEGIETEQEVALLRELSISEGQGFHWDEPRALNGHAG